MLTPLALNGGAAGPAARPSGAERARSAVSQLAAHPGTGHIPLGHPDCLRACAPPGTTQRPRGFDWEGRVTRGGGFGQGRRATMFLF